jgi:hypothetical protein
MHVSPSASVARRSRRQYAQVYVPVELWKKLPLLLGGQEAKPTRKGRLQCLQSNGLTLLCLNRVGCGRSVSTRSENAIIEQQTLPQTTAPNHCYGYRCAMRRACSHYWPIGLRPMDGECIRDYALIEISLPSKAIAGWNGVFVTNPPAKNSSAHPLRFGPFAFQ